MGTLVVGMCSICIYIVFLVFNVFFNTFFNLVLKRQAKTVNGTSISYLYLTSFF